MRKLLTALLALSICISAGAQTQNGINWGMYYITGSLSIGQGTTNTYAHQSALLQVGKDTATKGVRLAWVADTANVTGSKIFGLQVWQHKDSSEYLWIGYKWRKVVPATAGGATDTTSLSNRIDARVKYTDTASMLVRYLRKTDTTSMLSPYARKQTLNDTASAIRSAISLKVNISDFSTLFDNQLSLKTTTNLAEGTNLYHTPTRARSAISLTTTGTGAATYNSSTGVINVPNYTIDTAAMLANYLRSAFGVKYSDTAAMLANLYTIAASKVKYTDTAAMLSAYLRSALGVKYTDTASMLTPYLRKNNGTATGTTTMDYAAAKQYSSTIQTLTDGATITWNANSGCQATVTLGGTGRTLTVSNPIAGSFYIIKIVQGTGGSKTIGTWPTNTKWPGGTAPTLTTTAGSVDIVSFWYDGTNYNAVYSLDVK